MREARVITGNGGGALDISELRALGVGLATLTLVFVPHIEVRAGGHCDALGA